MLFVVVAEQVHYRAKPVVGAKEVKCCEAMVRMNASAIPVDG